MATAENRILLIMFWSVGLVKMNEWVKEESVMGPEDWVLYTQPGVTPF
jgi:hypothetical protein